MQQRLSLLPGKEILVSTQQSLIGSEPHSLAFLEGGKSVVSPRGDTSPWVSGKGAAGRTF